MEINESIDDILKEVKFKWPCNAYNLFIKEQLNEQKQKSNEVNYKIDLAIFANSWRNLQDNEKEKYLDLYKENKRKYQLDHELIRHYLFKDYDYKLRKRPTAYKIFLYEKIREALKNEEDLKKVKNEATEKWKNLVKDERQKYKDKKKKMINGLLKRKILKILFPLLQLFYM